MPRRRRASGRPQLNALYAGLFAYGFGRVGKVQSMHPTLSAKGLPELERALEYTAALALRTAAKPLGANNEFDDFKAMKDDDEDGDGDDKKGKEKSAEEKRLTRRSMMRSS